MLRFIRLKAGNVKAVDNFGVEQFKALLAQPNVSGEATESDFLLWRENHMDLQRHKGAENKSVKNKISASVSVKESSTPVGGTPLPVGGASLPAGETPLSVGGASLSEKETLSPANPVLENATSTLSKLTPVNNDAQNEVSKMQTGKVHPKHAKKD